MHMNQLDHIFKALADPTRLRILNCLLEAPGCVCELEPSLELPQPLISRHLAYLRNAGLVRDQRQGTRVNYRADMDDGLGRALKRFLRTIFHAREEYRHDLKRWRRRAALRKSPR